MKARTPSKDQGQSQYNYATIIEMLIKNDKDYLMQELMQNPVYVSLCSYKETVLQDKLFNVVTQEYILGTK